MDVVKEEIVQIREVLKNNPKGINVIDIAKKVNMNRQTVTKYLEMLIISGSVEVRMFGPSKVYYLTNRLPVSSMISLSSDFILLLDRDLNVVNVNDAFLEFTKTNKEDIMGKGIDAIPFPMEFDPPITQNITGALEGKESRIDAYYKKRGKEHFYDIKFIPIAFDNGKPGVTILFEDITERKLAEDSLRKLSMAVEQSPASVVITDIKGNIEYVNPKFTSITGYTKEEAIGKNPRILKSGETSHAIYKELWDTILAGGEWHGEFHNRKKNGDLYRESALIAPVKDNHGNITHLMAVKEDITERKKAEEALKESEMRYRTLFESMQEGFYLCEMIFDEGGRPIDYLYLKVNSAFARIMNMDPKQIIGRRGKEVVPELAEKWINVFGEVVKTGIPTQYNSYSDVFKTYFEVYVFRPSEGQFAVLVTDITERKRAEEALRESEARRKVAEAVEVERRRLYDVLETLPAMICLLTEDHRIAFANRSFTERFGETRGSRCYESCFGLSRPCDFCESYNVIKTGQPHHWEVKAPDGTVIEAHDYPFTDVDGSPMILEMDMDITERKRIEQDLKRVNRAYKILAKCKEAMIHAEDEQELLDKICHIIVDIGGYPLAWMGYLENDPAQTLRPVAWAGINNGYVENLKITLSDPERGNGPTAQCIRMEKPLIVSDVKSDTRMAPWRDAAMVRGFQAILNIPLVYDKYVIGNITIYAGEVGAFNEKELELMFELAGNLAYGITVLRDRAKRLAAEERLRSVYHN